MQNNASMTQALVMIYKGFAMLFCCFNEAFGFTDIAKWAWKNRKNLLYIILAIGAGFIMVWVMVQLMWIVAYFLAY